MSPASRPRRVRPFPFSELPRLLRVQTELGAALRQHIQNVIDAVNGQAGGLQDLTARIPGLGRIRTHEPYLLWSERIVSQLAGGWAFELSVGRSEREFVLAVEAAFCAKFHLSPEDVTRLLREALVGTEVRVKTLAADEVSSFLSRSGAQQAVVMDVVLWDPQGQGWARVFCRPDIQLWVPPPLSLAAELGRLQKRERLRMLPVSLTIEAGYGFLSMAEFAALLPGDIVVPDHFGPRPVTGGPVALRLRGGVFPAFFDGAGVTIMAPFHLRAESMADTQDHTTESAPPAGTQPLLPNDHLLRDLPVQIVCEIGRVTLTAREILDLHAGTVIQVGRPLAGPIDLTAGGRVIARGELVDVEGEIGIRIAEVTE